VVATARVRYTRAALGEGDVGVLGSSMSGFGLYHSKVETSDDFF
jgi:hypothetical protein